LSLLTLTFAAFIAGILGSIHCIGMCGGIACSVGYVNGNENRSNKNKNNEYQITFVTKKTSPFLNTLKFNFGRILSYSILGALFATIGHHIIHLSESRAILSFFRYFSALLIALIGFKYLFDLKIIDYLEKGGYRAWSWLKQKLNINQYLSNSSMIPLGMVWGLLPCGLIYTMLITASSSGTVWGGSLIMLAFGMGTLPAMLSISSIAKTLKESVNNQWMKTLFGIALLLLALLLVILEINTAPNDICHSV
jgi:sulfite exporter TauE/SafE